MYSFCKTFTRHVLIDSKGLGCPGQEAVPPQESDLLRPWSRWRCLEIRSWGVFIKSGMSYQEEGEQLWPWPGVCSTGITLSTPSLWQEDLSLIIIKDLLFSIKWDFSDVIWMQHLTAALQGCGWLQWSLVMARCCHSDIRYSWHWDTRDMSHSVTQPRRHVTHDTHRTFVWFPMILW